MNNAGSLMVGVIIGLCMCYLAGCTPQGHRRVMSVPSHATPTPATVHSVETVPEQSEITWTVAEPIKQQPKKMTKKTPYMAAGGKILTHEPGKKYTLYCPEFGTLSVVLPEGEQVQSLISGASGEWMIDKAYTGIEIQIPVITIRRAPWAPSTELQVITDAAIYQFLLHPQGKAVSKQQTSLITIINPETEARQHEAAEMRAEERERRRKEQAARQPQEAFSLLGRPQ